MDVYHVYVIQNDTSLSCFQGTTQQSSNTYNKTMTVYTSALNNQSPIQVIPVVYIAARKKRCMNNAHHGNMAS